jgi:hypothetical protein
MQRGFLLCLVCLVLTTQSCRRQPQSPVHFAREEIEMKVHAGFMEIRGMYHFTFSGKEQLTGIMHYPFPLDSSHAWPDSVSIPGRRFLGTDSGVSLKMRFTPGQEESLFVYYRQPVLRNTARYIVTTTRRWDRPIDQARFRVTVPRDLPGVRLNYEPDSTVLTDSTITWLFTRGPFWPSEDVIVTWNR